METTSILNLGSQIPTDRHLSLDKSDFTQLATKDKIARVDIGLWGSIRLYRENGGEAKLSEFSLPLPPFSTPEKISAYFAAHSVTLSQLSDDSYKMATYVRGVGGGNHWCKNYEDGNGDVCCHCFNYCCNHCFCYSFCDNFCQNCFCEFCFGNCCENCCISCCGNYCGTNGCTFSNSISRFPLHDAVRSADQNKVESLISAQKIAYQVRFVNESESIGCTRTYYGCFCTYCCLGIPVIGWICVANIWCGTGCEPLCGDQDTPLVVAAQSGNAEIVQMLLTAGADPHRRVHQRIALDYTSDPICKTILTEAMQKPEVSERTGLLSSYRRKQEDEARQRQEQEVIQKAREAEEARQRREQEAIRKAKEEEQRKIRESKEAVLRAYRAKQYLQVVQCFIQDEAFLEKLPFSELHEICKLKTISHFELKHYVETIEACTLLIQGDTNDLDLYALRGKAHVQLKHYQAAIEDFAKIIVGRIRDPELFYQRGICYQSLNQLDLAIHDFKATVHLNQNHLEAHLKLYQIHREQAALEELVLDCDQLIRLQPSRIEIYFEKQKTLVEMRRYQEALEAFEVLIQKDPTYLEAYVVRGLCFEKLAAEEGPKALKETYWKRAEEDYLLVLQKNVSHPECREGLARIEEERRRYQLQSRLGLFSQALEASEVGSLSDGDTLASSEFELFQEFLKVRAQEEASTSQDTKLDSPSASSQFQ